jgi:hypothetical protein
MRLPFTIDQFFDVFRDYNLAVWPVQWALVLAAVLAVLLAVQDRATSGRWVSGVLALLWFWMALAYHLAFFSRVNGAAVAFAVAFVGQGLLFARATWRGNVKSFRPESAGAWAVGATIIVYALVVYPILGYMLGHRYPAAPTFGVPCPTTLFTLGMLVWAGRHVPWWMFVVPLAWSVVATSAAISLGMTEDLGLVVFGIATACWLGFSRRPVTQRSIAATG